MRPAPLALSLALVAAAPMSAQAAAAGASESAEPLPPPVAYDSAPLSWRADELEQRIAVARDLCAGGDYGAAVGVLPDPENAPEAARRVRSRAAEALRLRDELLALVLEKGKRLAPEIDGERVGGRLVAVEGDHFVLRDKGEDHRLPLTALAPANLGNELRKYKLVGRSSWQKAWLDWLGGAPSKRVLKQMTEGGAEADALREQMSEEFVPGAGTAGVALVTLQGIEPGEDPEVARQQIEVFRAALAQHRDDSLFERRTRALEACVVALAERAFSLDDPDCLALHGQVRPLGDGRVAVEYEGQTPGLEKDLRLDEQWSDVLTKDFPRLATSEDRLSHEGAFWELVGSGVYTWAFPLTGPQSFEIRFEMTGGGIYVMVAALSETGVLQVGPDGSLAIHDEPTNLQDQLSSDLELRQGDLYTLRLENDGKSVVISRDGEEVSGLADIGTRTEGAVGLLVHGSSPWRIHSFKVEGRLDPGGALELRQKFVRRIVEELPN